MSDNFGMESSGAEAAVIDLSGVSEDSGFEAIPRGVYPCFVDEVRYEISKSSGNPMWTWVFQLSDGDYAGRKLFFHTPFTEKMLPRVKKILRIVAPEVLEGPFNPQTVADHGTLVGKACRVRVDIRPYEGEARNNVKDILPAEDTGSFM